MASTSIKDPIMMSYPKTLLSIVLYVGGLAVFLVLASSFLVSQPIGDAVTGYFYGVDHTQRIDLVTSVNKSADYSSIDSNVVENVGKSNSTMLERNGNEAIEDNRGKFHGVDDVEKKKGASESLDLNQFSEPMKGDGGVNSSSLSSPHNSNIQTNHKNESNIPFNGNKEDVSSSIPAKTREADTIDSECDLYQGKWVYDSAGPLYTNNSCPVLTQMQNCQGNGRPDKDYENWRWKPTRCDLPRFDGRKFLELMRGKTLAYIGDSVARNQMESMLCILWQVEVPKNRGNKRMQRYFFRSTSTMIVRIWSSWLVHQTSEAFDFAPAGVTKLHLDLPDEGFMDSIMDFDVLVLSSGHWFAKQSVYILNNEIVGGQLWWPDKSRKQRVNNIEAFAISVETILSALVTHPNYTGLTIVRSFSPDHYEGGAWNTGGSCTGKVKPANDTELFQNGFTNIMHEKQVTGFNRAIKKKTNKSQLKLMDITEVFQYRHDGHPGPYRSLDPNKITKRGPDGKPPPQDCLHWCMPGPVDTWNEMVFEIVRRQFDERTIRS